MDLKPIRVAMIGSGSWATALSKLLLNNLNSLNWFVRKPEDVAYFLNYKNNPRYLSSVDFPTEKIVFYTDLKACIAQSDLLILAVPSAFIHDTLQPLEESDLQTKIILK